MAKNILYSTLDKRAGSIGCYYLPKGLLKLDIRWVADEMGRPSLSFSADIHLVPDPTFRYYLNYSSSWLSSDKVDISYTPEGFLANIATEQTDETLNALVTVVQSIGSVLTGSGGGGTRDVKDIQMPENPQVFKGFIDPLDAQKVELLNHILAKHKLFFAIAPVSGDIASVNAQDTPSGGAGIYYRSFETFQIAIGSMDPRVGMSDDFLVSLPGTNTVQLAKIPMASFVTNTFNMTFANGVPQTVNINKPSSAMAMAKAPFDILSALIAMPSQLFQFKINLKRDNAINTESYADALLNQKLSEKKLADLEKRIAQGRTLTPGGPPLVGSPMGGDVPVAPAPMPLPPSTQTPLPPSNFNAAPSFTPIGESEAYGNDIVVPQSNF